MSCPAHASGLPSGRCESSALSAGMLRRDDPVDAWVASDRLVEWIHEDDLVELVTGVLANPVGGEHAHVAALTADAFLSNGLVGSGLLDLGEATGVAGLTIDASLLHWSFAASSADTDPVDDVALLSLVSKLASLVWARWTLALMDDTKLSVPPGPHSQHESDEI